MDNIIVDPRELIRKKVFVIHVRTRAPATELVKVLESGVLQVNIAQPPEHNKANLTVLSFFKQFLGKNVVILSGKKHKKKLIKILEE